MVQNRAGELATTRTEAEKSNHEPRKGPPGCEPGCSMLLGGRFILVGGFKCFRDDLPLISHHA
jgi:hypothetical protein